MVVLRVECLVGLMGLQTADEWVDNLVDQMADHWVEKMVGLMVVTMAEC